MRRYKSKHFFAFLLALAMLVTTVFPSSVSYAADVETKSETETVEQPTAPIFEEVGEEEVSENDIALNSEEVEEEEVYADDDVVRVFIVFEDEAVVEAGYSTEDIAEDKKAMAYSDKLEKTQDEVIEKIEDEVLEGESLEKRYSFTLLTNAVSAEVEYGAVEDIENVDGVSAVYVVPVYETLADDAIDPKTMTSGEMVGSYSTWASGYTGAGMRIAVIDTGLDMDHPSFTEEGFLAGLKETAERSNKEIADYNLLNKDEIASVADRLNAKTMRPDLTQDNTYYNAKVPFGFNYVDEGFDVTHDNDDQGDHGTHVAGIATANKYVPTEDGLATQALGVVGTAPDAQLFVMKVFGQNGGAYPDDYMAAIEDALLLGADTINLSLGSSSAGETAAAEEYINEIMKRLEGTNTVVCISAGNSANFSESSEYGLNFTSDVNADTVGSPGSYTNAFTVASAINTSLTGYVANANGVRIFYQDGTSGTNKPMSTLAKNGKETEYDYVLLKGIGAEEEYAGIDVKGKIVFVSRGSSSFSDKHNIAAKKGAIGVFVYNNAEGALGMNLSNSTTTIPCAGIRKSTAMEVAEASEYDEATNTYTGKITIVPGLALDFNVPEGYLMSDFSSWGVPGDLALKPEITAPGGNIYSTIDNGGYGVKSGTSMASPSMAGLSALVLQYIEENNLTQKTGLSARALTQSLLMSTAMPLTQADGGYYSNRKQGAGLANAYAAINTPAYLTVGSEAGNDGKVKIELGDDSERKGNYSFNFTVNNMSDKKAYYTFDNVFLTESVVEGVFTANNSYRLNPNVTIKTDSEQYLYDVDANGRVNLNDAYALLKMINKSASYAIVENFEDTYDFNDNGVIDTDDANTLMRAIACPRKSELNLKEKVFVVKNKANVSVNVSLSKDDRAYIDSNFENGMFVEGFVILKGQVDLSLPVLAFYGDWSDSSMFEPFDAMQYFAGSEDEYAYCGIARTNYLTWKQAGSGKTYYYMPNAYETDEEYIADRNAFSTLRGDKLDAFTFTLIRNASNVTASITNAETGEVYYELQKGAIQATYYSDSAASWLSTSAKANLGWAGTDAEGNALSDGTKINVSITALPAYYNNGKEAKGKGVTLTYPMTIDNTKPTAEVVNAVMPTLDVSGNALDTGALTVSVKDNRYVAAVKLYSKDHSKILASYPVNQNEAGEATEISIDPPHTVFFVRVIDYAGNFAEYRVNMSGIDDTEICDSIELSSTELGLIKGASETITANVGPLTLLDDSVVWTSSDETVASVNEDGVVTAVEKGEAVITATTVAKDKDGKNLTAECKVRVFTINTDLNAIVFDENSEVFFSTINTETRDFTRLSEKQSAPFWSAAVVGDYLYVAEETEDELKSNMYLVDPNTFESILIDSEDETRPWCTDMAYGLATEYLYGTYAYFVPVYTEEGAYDGVFNLSKYTQGEYLVGITYVTSSYIRSLGMFADIFYLIDRSGVIYELDILEDDRYGCVVLGETGITTEGKMKYQSLYYDYETDYFFYSNYDGGEESKLYAIEAIFDAAGNESFKTYKLGDFAEKVWPVAGLYRWENQRNDVDDSQVYISGDVTLGEKSATEEFESFVTGERRIPSLSDKPIKKLSEVNAEAAALAQAALEAKANEEAANEEVTEETEETTEETTATTPDESVDGEGEESVSGNE